MPSWCAVTMQSGGSARWDRGAIDDEIVGVRHVAGPARGEDDGLRNAGAVRRVAGDERAQVDAGAVVVVRELCREAGERERRRARLHVRTDHLPVLRLRVGAVGHAGEHEELAPELRRERQRCRIPIPRRRERIHDDPCRRTREDRLRSGLRIASLRDADLRRRRTPPRIQQSSGHRPIGRWCRCRSCRRRPTRPRALPSLAGSDCRPCRNRSPSR